MENSTAELIRKYKDDPSEALRNEIVLKNIGLVRACALSMRNLYVKYGEVDDVISEGVIALMDAVEKFDTERGAKFETFATLKIRGAIVDYIRKQDWIPRNIRKFARDLDIATAKLYNLYNRVPTNAEIADYMGLSEERLLQYMTDASNAAVISFEDLIYEDNFNEASKTEDLQSVMLLSERREKLAEAISNLKEKERRVITLYYYQNMKLSDIGRVMGLSESRICQINTKAVLALKAQLEPYIKGGTEG